MRSPSEPLAESWAVAGEMRKVREVRVVRETARPRSLAGLLGLPMAIDGAKDTEDEEGGVVGCKAVQKPFSLDGGTSDNSTRNELRADGARQHLRAGN